MIFNLLTIFAFVSYVADENGYRAGFRLGAAATGVTTGPFVRPLGPTIPSGPPGPHIGPLGPGSTTYLPSKPNVDRSYLPPHWSGVITLTISDLRCEFVRIEKEFAIHPETKLAKLILANYFMMEKSSYKIYLSVLLDIDVRLKRINSWQLFSSLLFSCNVCAMRLYKSDAVNTSIYSTVCLLSRNSIDMWTRIEKPQIKFIFFLVNLSDRFVTSVAAQMWRNRLKRNHEPRYVVNPKGFSSRGMW